jgi:hypothetical protein
MPGVGHVPRQIFARLAAAEDENVKRFRLSHDDLLTGALYARLNSPATSQFVV